MTSFATVNFGPQARMQVGVGEVNAYPGAGLHRLVLPLRLEASWLERDDPLAVAVAFVNGSASLSQQGHRFLGDLTAGPAEVRGYPTVHDVTLALTDEQLAGIEHSRGGGEVALYLRLRFTLLRPPGEVHPTQATEGEVRVRASRWVELLDQLGRELAVVVRVPLPLADGLLDASGASSSDGTGPANPTDTETLASRAQAGRRLRQAQIDLRDGRWDQCVATCRKVLENIEKLTDVRLEADVAEVKPMRRTQDERWAGIFHAARGLANAAPHDDPVTSQFVWTQAEAEAFLGLTAALVRRYTA